MEVFLRKTMMDLLLEILRLLDGIFGLFLQLTGIEKINTMDGEPVELVDYFMQSDLVVQVFWTLFLISIILIAISIVVSVIKSIVNLRGGDRKTHSKSIGQGFGSIIIAVIMFVITLGGMSASNNMLEYINKSFNQSDANSLGLIVFEMSVEGKYEIDYENPVYQTDEEGDLVLDENEQPIIIGYYFKLIDNANGWGTKIDGSYYSIEDIDLRTDSGDSVFGMFNEKGLLGFENIDSQKKDSIPKVGIKNFNFLIAYFGALSLIVVLTISLLALVKRIYDIILLFLALPFVTATIAMDDGARFKAWREAIVSKTILAYGTVFAVNVFLIIMNSISGLDFSSLGFFGIVLRLFLIVGGALSINGGQILFARLLGTSAEESREMSQAARAVVAGGVAAHHGAQAVKNRVIGSRTENGYQSGMLQSAGSKLKGTLNTMGSVLAGNYFGAAKNAIKTKKDSLTKAIKGAGTSYMEKGGLAGIAASRFSGGDNNNALPGIIRQSNGKYPKNTKQ